MAAPLDPGSVILRMRLESGHARDVRVRSERPDVAGALRGREADAAVRMLPLLYAICGSAQALAARLALAAARGQPAVEFVDAATLAEARREHLWRLLLDWPQALGLARREDLFIEGRRRSSEAGFGAWAQDVLLEPLAEIERAIRNLPQVAADRTRLLPSLGAEATLAPWPCIDAGFAALPTWQGGAAETGAYARRPGIGDASPLLARVRARAADLSDPAGLGRASSSTVAPGIGRAAVETARGLLLHEIVLDGERVADYRIVAPTEWNFHPSGTLRAWLDGANAPTRDALRAFAACAVLALDPCVRVRIEIDGD